MSTPVNRVIAGLALLVLSPVFVVVAVIVRIRLGTPVLFRQVRPGRHGQPFELVKFRTMTDEVDAHGALLPDDQRLTSFGRLLRSTSLDELPELWNVVRGEMHLVGPRPLLMQYLELYSPHQSRRMEVPPGITGLAQVSGRNELDWPARLDLDVEYVDRRSTWLDLTILARTALTVVGRRGITTPGAATGELFRGNDDA